MTRPQELSEFADYWRARAVATGEDAKREVADDGFLAAILATPAAPEPEAAPHGTGPAWRAQQARDGMRAMRKPLGEMQLEYMRLAEERAKAEQELLHNAYEAEWPEGNDNGS